MTRLGVSIIFCIVLHGISESLHGDGNAESDLVCSTKWQSQYVNVFQSIMSNNNQSMKAIVNVPVKSGLCDVLLGYITGFLFALLTNRAYFIQRVDRIEFNCDKRMIEYAYEYRNFNWHSPFNISHSHWKCLIPASSKPCTGGPIHYGTQQLTWRHVNTINDNSVSQGGHNFVAHFGDGNENIILHSGNRGPTYNVFKNPIHNKTLYDMGLRPENLFSCIFHFLFKLRPEVCQGPCLEVEDKLKTLGKEGVIRIGIQVRDGLEGHDVCAESLAKYYESQGKKTVFILVTQIEEVQAQFVAKYKDKVILPLGVPKKVSSFDTSQRDTNCTAEDLQHREGIHNSARDLHILSLTDIAIATKSGFGLLGYMMAPRKKYILYHMRLGKAKEKKNCGDFPDGDSLQIFADDWSGLRYKY